MAAMPLILPGQALAPSLDATSAAMPGPRVQMAEKVAAPRQRSAALVGAAAAACALANSSRKTKGKRSLKVARCADAEKSKLVHDEDTWRIVREGEEVPAGATVSDCTVEPSTSEFAGETKREQAWISHSAIPFDYRVVEVPHGQLLDPSCDALLFGHLPAGSEERKAAEARPQRRLIIIDETVNDIYGGYVRTYFQERGVEHELYALPMVEEKKSMELTLQVAKKMKEFNIDRRTEPVIAIGGGVCLDVVGLAASMFRRRTPYIRVPTTTLSYVDASVGAKNGVNFGGSKNRLGTYVPPCAALLDSCFFRSQTSREVSNGMAEMAKMAIMKSPELFCLLEEHGERLAQEKFAPRGEADKAPRRVLQLSIETMLEELAPNLWEHSLDRLVDFGHAVGQDLEMAALDTEEELMHGESVACDMALMTCLSCQLGLITTFERDRILNMLVQCQVPLWSPVFTYSLFMEAVGNREKNSMGQKFPLPVGIGRAQIVNDVSVADLKQAYLVWRSVCSEHGLKKEESSGSSPAVSSS